MKQVMTCFIIISGICLTAVSARAQVGNFLWAEQAGGTGFDKGTSIAADVFGNTIITGYFQGTAAFGSDNLNSSGFKDIFISKIDNSGNILWARQAGGINEDEGHGIATDSLGNITVTGFFFDSATFGDTTLISNGSYDIFIARYDSDGNVVWARQAGGTSLDRGFSTAMDGSGNCFATGYFSGTAIFGDTSLTSDGQDDIFIVKYDNQGDFIWAVKAGGQFFDQGYGIATDKFGNAIVTGKFSSQATFGDTTISSSRLFNTFISKYDPQGNLLWVRKAGGRDDFGYGIATDRLGNSLVTGYFQESGDFSGIGLTSAGSGDVFIAKYDPEGGIIWAIKAGSQDLDQGFCIATDSAGSAVVSGFFVGSATFGDTILNSSAKDIFVAKYDQDGNFRWAVKAGGIATDEGNGITADGAGNVIVTGSFEDLASFGNTDQTSAGAEDIIITKLGTGSPTSIKSYSSPHIFRLSQNYPNPFNPMTRIDYSVPQTEMVRLEIFNPRGQRVAMLVNGRQEAGGHNVTWDGRGYPSGIYFYRIQAGHFTQTRKMLLIQ